MVNIIPKLSSLDPFLRGYLLAAYWTNDDDAPSGDYLESSGPDILHGKLSGKAFQQARRDCCKFEMENLELIKDSLSEAGHCFWLSRCGHGSGFFDSEFFNSDENRDELQDKARKFGNLDLYIGDDGQLYT